MGAYMCCCVSVDLLVHALVRVCICVCVFCPFLYHMCSILADIWRPYLCPDSLTLLYFTNHGNCCCVCCCCIVCVCACDVEKETEQWPQVWCRFCRMCVFSVKTLSQDLVKLQSTSKSSYFFLLCINALLSIYILWYWDSISPVFMIAHAIRFSLVLIRGATSFYFVIQYCS